MADAEGAIADVARLGIVVDADGAVKQIRLTSAELAKLANQSVTTGGSLKAAFSPTTEQHIARTNAQLRLVNQTTPGLNRLTNQLGNMAATLSGLPGPIGRVASSLGQFAIGGVITVAVLAGIAAITFAWRKAGEQMRESEAAMKRLAEGATGMSEAAMRAKLAIHQQREANLAQGLEAFGGRKINVSIDGERRRQRQLETERAAVAALGQELAKLDRQRAASAVARPGGSRSAGGSAFEYDPWQFLKDIDKRRKESAEAAAHAEEDAAKRAADAWRQAHYERMAEIDQIVGALEDVGSFAINKLAGAAGPFGGMVSGIGMNLLAGNPWGAAAAGITGLVDGIIGLGRSSAEARERLRQVNRAYEEFTDSIKEQLGIISSLEARTRATKREFADMRRELGLTGEAGDEFVDVWGRVQKTTGALAESARDLNRYEAERIEQLKKLAELDRLDESIRKVQDRIASFVQTIGGLQDFRNSLLLSPTMSPADRLKEAQRQYAEIMGVARGDDIEAAQAAAGRLPGAAQTLLDAARAMFGSGSGFQDIFAGTLADTQELINRFTDLKTIEELMLDELRRIREATERGLEITEAPHTPPIPWPGGSVPTGGGGSGPTAGGGNTAAVTAAGFSALLVETQRNTAAIRDLAHRVQTGLAARAN